MKNPTGVVMVGLILGLPLGWATACSCEKEKAAPAAEQTEATEAEKSTSRHGGRVNPDEMTDADAIEKATEGAQTLGKTLKDRLLAAMGEGGAASAVKVCSSEAQTLTAKVEKESGVKVGRASLKLRNEKNDAAPEWVKAWLKEREGKSASSVLGVSRVVPTGDKRVAQVLMPIRVEGACLACHGAPDGIDPEVKALLSEKYPNDVATGYAEGDLRGALWAEFAYEANQKK